MKGDCYVLYSEDKESMFHLLRNENVKKGESFNFGFMSNKYVEHLKEIGEMVYIEPCDSYVLSVDKILIEKLQKEKKKLLENEKLKNCYLSTLNVDDDQLIKRHWAYSSHKENDYILKKRKHCENSCLRNEKGDLMGWILRQNVKKKKEKKKKKLFF